MTDPTSRQRGRPTETRQQIPCEAYVTKTNISFSLESSTCQMQEF
jgi:hypothetical protein